LQLNLETIDDATGECCTCTLCVIGIRKLDQGFLKPLPRFETPAVGIHGQALGVCNLAQRKNTLHLAKVRDDLTYVLVCNIMAQPTHDD